LRILIADTVYDEFLRTHYRSQPGLEEAPYAHQWRVLMDTFFGTADSYSHFLGLLGHEAHEVVVNCGPLQSAWAAERRMRLGRARLLRRRNWRHAVLLEQARAFEPDVVYVQNLRALPPDVLRALRKRTRMLAGQVASELPPPESLRLFQLVLTSFPHYVPRLRALGVDAEYLRIGFDPRVLERLGRSGPRAGVVFVGSLRRGRHGANELLARAAERVPVDFHGYGVEEWPDGSIVRARYRGEAWGLDMYRVLAGAQIALNRHIDAAEDSANNMRLYEATGVGTLLVTDAKENLRDLFEPGREVLTYTDEDELVEAVRRILSDDDERNAIARAGQERTLREHTYAQRMRELAEILAAHAAGR
jgi:glycosyltransferase involved in cell wall biosynthesis